MGDEPAELALGQLTSFDVGIEAFAGPAAIHVRDGVARDFGDPADRKVVQPSAAGIAQQVANGERPGTLRCGRIRRTQPTTSPVFFAMSTA